MKAVVFKGIGEIALEQVPDPVIQDPKDVIVKITRSAICGTDLHFVRGTVPGVKPGTILGHEGVGIIEQVGPDVKLFKIGDRVIIPSTIACGYCDYCKREIYAQCDNANPNGKDAGTAFYGGPMQTGSFNGLQAEKARIPFADIGLVKIPDSITDNEVLILSDILPTAYMAVEFINPEATDSVAVFGCGPVGQLVIACLKQAGVKKILAIDRIEARLNMAEKQGALPINFDLENPVSVIKKHTRDGASKVIDAVGIDADQPHCCGLPYFEHILQRSQFKQELNEIAPAIYPHDGNWYPGTGPSQVLQWAVQSVAKAGTVSIIGVYSQLMHFFPIGSAMNKNLTLKMGNCNHRKYIPELLSWIRDKRIDPLFYITDQVPFDQVINAYKKFDKRENGIVKVMLKVT
jgi:threonine dehydrogenase-like Zn-dependent dehydrogenase